jgi:hypothetical protein
VNTIKNFISQFEDVFFGNKFSIYIDSYVGFLSKFCFKLTVHFLNLNFANLLTHFYDIYYPVLPLLINNNPSNFMENLKTP